MNEREQLIVELPLLERLPRKELLDLAEHARVQLFPAGSAIIQEGEPGDSLHAILDGSIRISILSPTGIETTIALLGPGECFGELALLDGRPRSATAIAVRPTKTLVVTRGDFVAWLAERPQSALMLLETLSLRLRRTNESLVDMAFSDLSHRLPRRLLRLAGSTTRDTLSSLAGKRLSITQSGLASMLGVSRESVNKQLKLLTKRGWLEVRRGSITILDPVALRDFEAG